MHPLLDPSLCTSVWQLKPSSITTDMKAVAEVYLSSWQVLMTFCVVAYSKKQSDCFYLHERLAKII
jgi:hypothetical protein